MCDHTPCCPSAGSATCRSAHTRVRNDQQGWCLLCNGVIVFDDGGAILPDGGVLDPPAPVAALAADTRPSQSPSYPQPKVR